MENNRTAVILLGLIVVVIAFAVMKILASFLVPLVIAMLFSFALMPISSFFSRRKIPYWLSIILMMTIFFICILIIGFFLYSSVNTVVREFPQYFDRIETLTGKLITAIQARVEVDISTFLSEFDWISPIQSALLSVSGGSVDFVKSLGVVIIFLLFFLIESPLFQKTIRKAFPRETSYRLIRVYMHVVRDIGRYLGLKLLISLVTGILVFGSLSLIGLDFAFIWGVLAFFLNFIPSIGSIISMAVTILMGIVQFYPSAGKIFLVAFAMISIQVVMGNILDPRLSGKRLKLSPLLILLSLFLWGWIWGIAGMFLAVPLLSVIKILCENIPQLKPVAVVLENGRGEGIHKKNRDGNKPKLESRA
ncbi:MAG: AI-2E family transporter [Spirochaetales bacterium]|nr:AI-2E family transporter [Spirochaetales bacterium]